MYRWVKSDSTTKQRGLSTVHGVESHWQDSATLSHLKSQSWAQKSPITGLTAEFTAMCYLYRFIFIHPIITTYQRLKFLSEAFVGITIPPLPTLHLLQK